MSLIVFLFPKMIPHSVGRNNKIIASQSVYVLKWGHEENVIIKPPFNIQLVILWCMLMKRTAKQVAV